MSSQIALKGNPVSHWVAGLIESPIERASPTAVKFEREPSNSKRDEPLEIAAPLSEISTWIQATSTQSSSPIRKGGTFVLVVLAHALLLYALSRIAPEVSDESPPPLQVISIEAPQAARDAPPPPIPLQRVPIVDVPIEPVIDIAVVESNAITVAPSQVEPVAPTPSSIGAPKIVSTVEYIREPIAKYPAAARSLKQRGTVTLRALIDATGHAREVNVHNSSGFRLLDDTARTAVLNALFKPYMENGQSIPVYVFIPIEFGASS
jgi:protein TonB